MICTITVLTSKAKSISMSCASGDCVNYRRYAEIIKQLLKIKSLKRKLLKNAGLR